MFKSNSIKELKKYKNTLDKLEPKITKQKKILEEYTTKEDELKNNIIKIGVITYSDKAKREQIILDAEKMCLSPITIQRLKDKNKNWNTENVNVTDIMDMVEFEDCARYLPKEIDFKSENCGIIENIGNTVELLFQSGNETSSNSNQKEDKNEN